MNHLKIKTSPFWCISMKSLPETIPSQHLDKNRNKKNSPWYIDKIHHHLSKRPFCSSSCSGQKQWNHLTLFLSSSISKSHNLYTQNPTASHQHYHPDSSSQSWNTAVAFMGLLSSTLVPHNQLSLGQPERSTWDTNLNKSLPCPQLPVAFYDTWASLILYVVGPENTELDPTSHRKYRYSDFSEALEFTASLPFLLPWFRHSWVICYISAGCPKT